MDFTTCVYHVLAQSDGILGNAECSVTFKESIWNVVGAIVYGMIGISGIHSD